MIKFVQNATGLLSKKCAKFTKFVFISGLRLRVIAARALRRMAGSGLAGPVRDSAAGGILRPGQGG